MTLDEAAGKLGVKPCTAREYARTKQIPARKVGRYWQFVEADIDNFIRDGYDSTCRTGATRQQEGLCPDSEATAKTGKSRMYEGNGSPAERRTATQPQRLKRSTKQSAGNESTCLALAKRLIQDRAERLERQVKSGY